MRARLRANVPGYYHGAAHLVFTLAVSLGSAAALLLQVRDLRASEIAAVPLFFLFCCLVEYLEHRYLLHRRTWIGAAAFRIHTLEHHEFFTEEEFQPDGQRDYAFVLFPPALVVAYQIVLVAPFTAIFHRVASPNVGWLVGFTGSMFFFLYEIIHLASHLGERFPVAPGLFRWLGDHHRLHHRTELMTRYNFNVVCPVFDWVFGTLARPRAPE
jgi:sterol desaturase/sphingolipid hydroxylase (fatty acid hydroxylase superfamily)